MTRAIVTLITLVVFSAHVRSQEPRLWIRLSEDRVIIVAEFRAFDGDSLIVVRAGLRRAVPLQEIQQVRLISESGILRGACIGAGVGLAAGGITAFLLRSPEAKGFSPAATVVILGTLGVIAGSVAGSMDAKEEIVELESRSIDEKRDIIRKLVDRSRDISK